MHIHRHALSVLQRPRRGAGPARPRFPDGPCACGAAPAAGGGARPPIFMLSPARSGAVSVGRKRPAPRSSRPGAGDEDEPKRHPGASLCRRVGEAPGAALALSRSPPCATGLFLLACPPLAGLAWGRRRRRPGAAAWGHLGRAAGAAPLLRARGAVGRRERAALGFPPRALRPFRARCARSGPAPSVALCHGWNAGPWGGGGGGFP